MGSRRATAGGKLESVSQLRILLEDIRLTAINLAVSASKIRTTDPAGSKIRKVATELVTISLQAVDRVSADLDGLDETFDSESEVLSHYVSQLEAIEIEIDTRVNELTRILNPQDGDI